MYRFIQEDVDSRFVGSIIFGRNIAALNLRSANVTVSLLLIISASLHRAKRSWYGKFTCPMCPSAHVTSGKMADWIWMPFWVVSGVGLVMVY